MSTTVKRRRLLIDVTDTLARDQRTGIQRVVREFADHLPFEAGAFGFQVVFVAAVAGRFHQLADKGRQRLQRSPTAGGTGPSAQGRLAAATLHMLRSFPGLLLAVQQWNLGRRITPILRPLIEAECLPLQPSDVVLLLDSYWGGTTSIAAGARARSAGAAIVPVVYDLIPLTHPSHSVPLMTIAFTRRVQRALNIAQGCLTISATCAEQLRALIGDRTPAVPVRHFHLGNDPVPDAKTEGSPIGAGHTFVMVGSIEAHKGHDVALRAFEQLWNAGIEAKLTIVGRLGKANVLIDSLTTHAELGNRLTIISDASDRQVQEIMKAAAATIMASRVEGFGLPLVESLRLGVPVIASDIDIFREIGGDAVSYFVCGDPNDLARAIKQFQMQAPLARERAAAFSWIGWAEASRQALSGIAAIAA